MRHVTSTVFGVFDKPVHMYRGTAQSGIVMDEARLDTKRGFRRRLQPGAAAAGSAQLCHKPAARRMGPRPRLGD